MVKGRMTSADVAAEVACLRRLIGMRVANVYDINPKTYVLKLAKSGGITDTGESEKELLLLESGIRFHTTKFSRDKSITPSGFTLKLRKHIRTRRLEDVRQLGIDRVVDFQFGLGEGTHHLLLELYSQGNILLTDGSYKVLALLRSHRDDEKGISMMVYHQYPIAMCRAFERTAKERMMAVLKGEVQRGAEGGKEVESKEGDGKGKEEENGVMTTKDETGAAKKGNAAAAGKKEDGAGGKGGQKAVATAMKGSGKKQGGGGDTEPTLKTVLGDGLAYGPSISEHIILDAGLSPNIKVGAVSGDDRGGGGQVHGLTTWQVDALLEAVTTFEDWFEGLKQMVPDGFVVMQKKAPTKGGGKAGKVNKGGKDRKGDQQQNAEDGKENEDGDQHSEVPKLYAEFVPFLMKQLYGCESIKFETFDAAMDDFFSKIEGQRLDQQRRAAENVAIGKLDKIRADQAKRVQVLQEVADLSVRKAELIEYNLDDVDAAIIAVRGALASGMDWKELARMVKDERKAGNPIAGLIHSLQLEKNQITLLLSNNLDDMDEEEKTRPADKVEVDLALSAHANARMYFDAKKKHITKQQKTLSVHGSALKAAEKKTNEQLAQAKRVAKIVHMRKVHWFEKFHWFISSENYLVISGKDAQQNEIIVKRYLKKGDLYVHAELHGATSCVIKNPNPTAPVPPLTLNQAGCMTVCRSAAWDSKIVTSAWWVYHHQVSKTAPTGEYLPTGSFMIRGRKNFLPPNPLLMGFGFVFRLDDASIAAHVNERRVRVEGEEEVEVPKDGNTRRETTTASAATSVSPNAVASAAAGDDDDVDDDGDGDGDDNDDDDDDDELIDDIASIDGIIGGDAETADEAVIEKGDANTRFASGEGEKDGDSQEEEDAEEHKKDRPWLVRLGAAETYELDQGLRQEEDDEGGNIEEVAPRVEGEEYKGENTSKGGHRDKHYLSIAERRRLKKGGLQGKKKPEESVEGDEHKGDSEGRGGKEEETEAAMTTSGRIQRGRRSRLKKIKEKYADQDEEERELRMTLLGSAGVKKNGMQHSSQVKNTKGAGKDRKGGTEGLATASHERAEDAEEDVSSTRVCYKCKQVGHIARDCRAGELTSRIGEDAEGGASRAVGEKKDGLSRRARARAEEAEISALLVEENILELREEDREKLTELDSLTGIPREDDGLMYAVPVCGPYSALQNYKYKVKLTPGTMKKGKAARMAVEVFTRMLEVLPRHKDLMKAVPETELVAVMIGNVKLAAPGLMKIQRGQKRAKKVAAKG